MPNFKKHATAGAIVGGGLNLAWQLNKIFESPEPPKDIWDNFGRIDFLELAAFTFGGAAIASIPDMLEPASTPNRRAAFHSLICGGAVTNGAFGEHTENLPANDKYTLRVAALSYLSHLRMDLGTPKGLPLIGIAPKNIVQIFGKGML